MFKQNNAGLDVASIVLFFLDSENVQLLPRFANSPDLSPIENAWSMVDKRVARHHTLTTVVNGL